MRRPCFAALSLLVACAAVHAEDDDAPTYAFGAGAQRLPAWQGSKDHRNQAIPYIDIEIPGVGEVRSIGILGAVDMARPGATDDEGTKLSESIFEAAQKRGLLLRVLGTSITTVFGLNRRLAFIRSAVWLCRMNSHHDRGTNSASTTVTGWSSDLSIASM